MAATTTTTTTTTATTATATTDSSASSFFSAFCGSSPERRPARPNTARGCTAKLDGVGMWIVNGFSAAFFASLERLSCIRIATHEDEGDSANDAVPLILNDYGNDHHVVIKHGNSSNGNGRLGRRSKGKGVRKEMKSFVEDF